MNNTLYSVIIPAYHAEEFIGRALLSIEKQTIRPVEVLVGVDACRETLGAVQQYVSGSTLLIRPFYFPSHAGCYKIRNTLAAAAKTETLMFFDADDEMYPHYASSMLDTLAELPPNGLARANMFLLERRNTSPAVSQIAITKRNFLKLGGFEPWGCSGDTEFYQRVKQAGFTDAVVFLPNMIYHVHGGNLTVAAATGMRSPMRLACHREIERRQLSVEVRSPGHLSTAPAIELFPGDPVPDNVPVAESVIILGFGVDDDLAKNYTAEKVKHICGEGELWTISDWYWRFPQLKPDKAVQIHVGLSDTPLPAEPWRWRDWRSRYAEIGSRAILGAADPAIPEATVHDMQAIHDNYGGGLTTSSISCAMLIALHHYSTKCLKLFGVPLTRGGAYRHQGDGLLKTCELCERNGITVVWPERDFVAADVARHAPPLKFLTPYWKIGG
jgi:glycosyltransferase involved in cell wall biosynthesis